MGSPGENDGVQPALIALFLVVAAVLIVRAANRDRREYGRFKSLTSSRERRATFARWLAQSFFTFGGLTVAVVYAASSFVPLVLADARAAGAFAWALSLFTGGFATGFAIGASIAVLAVLIVPVFALRRQITELPTVGDIAAILPRSRREIGYGAALALNAGLVEELLFRLAIPALIYGIVGNGLVAFAVASLLFGLLHVYQGIPGVLGATLLGLLFSAVYVLTGSIIVVIVLHAFVDLRSLVLIPIVVQRVHRVTDDYVPAAAPADSPASDSSPPDTPPSDTPPTDEDAASDVLA